MKYKMRNLKMADVYKVSRIIKKMEIKPDFKELKGKTQEEVGGELVLKIVENLSSAQTEINEFIGSLIGITGEEFAELSISESRQIIEEFKRLPDLRGFFDTVGRLMK